MALSQSCSSCDGPDRARSRCPYSPLIHAGPGRRSSGGGAERLLRPRQHARRQRQHSVTRKPANVARLASHTDYSCGRGARLGVPRVRHLPVTPSPDSAPYPGGSHSCGAVPRTDGLGQVLSGILLTTLVLAACVPGARPPDVPHPTARTAPAATRRQHRSRARSARGAVAAPDPLRGEPGPGVG